MTMPVRVPRRAALPLSVAAAALALAVAIPACSSDGGTNPPDGAAAMAVVSGNNQTGFVGTVLTQPLVVHVEDAAGADLSGATVNWTVMSGGGTVASAATTTGANGRAQTQLTLGASAGANTVRASVAGTALSVTFTATGVEPPPDVTPASITIVGGNNQTGPAGAELPDSLKVEVKNADGTSLPNIPVTWTVTGGGGSLGAASGSTNADGIAANAWTLGGSAGANTVTATVTGAGTLTATFTATGTLDPTPASIEIASGNNQSATVSTALANPLVARVRNGAGQLLQNVVVAWTVTGGGGSLGAATSTTDALGLASNTYTVGASAGANTIHAAVQSNTALNVDFTATATVAGAAVSVQDSEFNPFNADVAAGGAVTWTWVGALAHNVTWVGGGFTNSATQSTGTHQVTFPSAGTYTYYCDIHGTPTTGMRGTVTVQ
jgi:plastocyanin